MENANHPRIDFDALIHDYLENLNITLRGFNSAEQFDFLSTFVPSDDPTASLLEVLELARDERVPKVTLILTPAVVKQVDLKKLTSREPNYSSRQVEGKTELEFSLT